MAENGNHFKDDADYTRNWVSMLMYALLEVEQVKRRVGIEKLCGDDIFEIAELAADRYLERKERI